MKALLLPTLLASAGFGWLGLARHPADPCAEGCPPGARLEVVCADDGSCAVVCLDADGEPICSQAVACDAPCAPSADAPSPCAPSPGCRAPAR